MGINTRRGIKAAALAATAAMLAASVATAAPTDPFHDDDDFRFSTANLETVDGNNKVFRAAGRDRVDTAIQLMCHATNKSWEGVIIARSDDFADALTSGPLADVTDYALLVMPSGKLDASVVAAIKAGCNDDITDNRTDIDDIIMIGGTGVWSEALRAELQEETDLPVTRISGINRYDTAVEIADTVSEEIGERRGVSQFAINAYIATGTNFPDALAAGAAAAANDGVVLLTNGDKMHEKTEAFLDYQYEWMPSRISHIEHHAVGGPAIRAMEDGDIRIDAKYDGDNRYHTAVLLAESYAQRAETITIASGENYPDGVVAGAFAANHDGPLLLTQNANLTPVTEQYLRFKSDLHAQVMVVGGVGSVSRAVSTQVMAALKF